MRIVLLIVDSLRADAPGYAGGAARTPALDRLAAEGTVARTAFAPATWTVPSIGALATGVHAHRLGLYRWDQPLPARHPSVFTLFADAGATVASFVFDPDYLLAAEPDAAIAGSSQDLDAVIAWIERCDAPDLLVLVHHWGTHFPYVDRPVSGRAWRSIADPVLAAMRAAPGAVVPKLRALYDRAVERASERLVPRLAAAVTRHARPDRGGALLVVTADHGERWPDRPVDAFDLHGRDLHDDVLRVPLVLWGSAAPAGRVIEGPVQGVDLAPTLLELAGVPAPDGVDGRSLVPCLRPGGPTAPAAPASAALAAAAPASAALAVSVVSAEVVSADRPPASPGELWRELALRGPRWKLRLGVADGRRAVTDLAADPAEAGPPLAAGAGEPPAAWDVLEAERRRCAVADPPDAAVARLRALGYLD